MAQFGKVLPITGEWECMECGYIEEGNELRPPSKCPECNAPASALEFFSYEEDEWDREKLEYEPDYEDEDYEELEDYEDYEEEEDER
jgi:hypothetical protein